ncbi:MAG TPA: hypothetical protein VGM30_15150, partial [Puia sp.]
MYSSDQTHRLQKLTTALLLPARERSLGKAKLEELKEILRFHEHRYAILNDPLISDFEYDTLYKNLEKIEAEHPELISPDSPTQRVAKGLTKEFPTVQHLVPMLSLENSYNEADLLDWDRKARELTGLEELEYCVEPKFDGASISLTYENDQLLRGVTRGDGVAGDEITTNIRQIRSVPLSAAFSRYGLQLIEIRGEVLMNKDNFKKYNDQLTEQGNAPLANPRNAAAGSLRIKDSREVSRRNLEAFLYHVSYFTTLEGWQVADGHVSVPGEDPAPEDGAEAGGAGRQGGAERQGDTGRQGGTGGGGAAKHVAAAKQAVAAEEAELPVDRALKTHSGSLKMLWDLGFRSPQKEKQVVKGIRAVIDYCRQFEKQRDDLPYEIDGMVIKVNSIALQDRMGMTTHHPRWAIAFKFKARQATSTLRKVEFQVGRTGSITPVAKIDPVPLSGVTVSSVSLFNEEMVREKDLRI